MVTDYIVVGGGAAGCVVAARLSELRQLNVLLLEAGPADPGPDARTPLAWPKMLGGPFDWGFQTEEEPYLERRRLAYPRGKVLGGSTALYAGIYSRGDRLDYDSWRELGNAGWGWDYVAPYFEKSLKQGLPREPIRQLHPLTQSFLGHCPDARGVETMHRRGKKPTASDIFLDQARKERPNLTVVTGANVVRVLVHEGRAFGVEVIRDGRLEIIQTRFDVVLCAGAIQSPAILLRSGIGPASHLESAGIPVLADLPGVGENLQDHVRAGLEFHTDSATQLASNPGLFDQLRYWANGSGPLASPVVEAVYDFKSQSDATASDLQMNFVPRCSSGNGVAIWTTLLRPLSRGYLRLRSADPNEGPSIRLNVLEEPEDRSTLEKGLEVARAIGEKMGTLQPQVQYDVMWHACGTCRMGPDRMAVVDSDLKVHGLQGLRIIDASIMPTIPGGNTAAPTLMIAERGADLIRC